ncbi:hypothetical protein JJC00_25140 [Bradyrhizobium diazoefficiens]|uniref:biotin/lipoate--protein ligase family protein n=1 Tax=Bradyrhizobium diazoefficiens TaxID=1355477 RepID=UPI00190AC969|nr:biotin/lipoate--protein ligase family protein [Bradyrhizobium diazoefficiens]QQO31878.1 hypothetical protein JJC00_25140 [Bradyrhizobium diazoefficiens]
MEAVLRSIPTSHVSTAEPIQLPPPFSLVRLRESGDAFAHACRIAPERGAGTPLGWPASADEDEPPTGAGQLTESFARHLMRAIDSWQVDGFDSVARDYLGRMPRERQAVQSIDDRGDLLTRRIASDTSERADLAKALAAPSWLDPDLGGPGW